MALAEKIPQLLNRAQMRNTANSCDYFGVGAFRQIRGVWEPVEEEPQHLQVSVLETFDG